MNQYKHHLKNKLAEQRTKREQTFGRLRGEISKPLQSEFAKKLPAEYDRDVCVNMISCPDCGMRNARNARRCANCSRVLRKVKSSLRRVATTLILLATVVIILLLIPQSKEIFGFLRKTAAGIFELIRSR